MPAFAFLRALWRSSAPVREPAFAFALLISLAIAVTLGVAFPQESMTPIGQIRARFGDATPLLRAMGLFSVYGAPWFLLLEGLLFVSLALGSFQWLKPAFLAATRPTFRAAEELAQDPEAFTLDAPVSLERAQQALRSVGYRLAVDRGGSDSPSGWRLYATRGHWGRLGPAIAHLGVLLLLASSVYGAFTGFTARKLLAPQEAFSLRGQADALMTPLPPPLWQGRVPDWHIRLNAFRALADARDPGATRQYESDLTLMDAQGRSIVRGVAAVNQPLRAGGLALYQAGFAPTGQLELTVNGASRLVQTSHRLLGRPVALTPAPSPESGALAIFPALRLESPDAPLTLDPSRAQALLIGVDGALKTGRDGQNVPITLRAGQSTRLGRALVRYDGAQYASALLIQHSPETPAVFVAFALIGLGAALCALTQRQCWLSARPNGRVEGALRTHRPTASLWRDRQALLAALQTSAPPP